MPEPSTERPWVAETRFSGVIAELRLPRASVARLLPPELCLEPRVARARTAPVLMAFGTHTASAVHLAALRVRTGVTFNEVFFGVRCQIKASRTPVLFVPLMYCDEPVSTWVGNSLYGFNKQSAVMEWLGKTFVVMSDDGRVLLEIATLRGGGEVAASSWLAGRAVVPMLGLRADRTYVSSCFSWESPAVRGIRTQVIVSMNSLAIPDVTNQATRARMGFGVTTLSWRMGWPHPCHDVRRVGHVMSAQVMLPTEAV